MKRFRILLICLLVISCVFVLFACSNNETPKEGEEEKIEVDYSLIDTVEIFNPDSLLNPGFLLSEFDIKSIKFVIKYTTEETIDYPLSMNYIIAEDQPKLSVAGTHTIRWMYGKFTGSFKIKLYNEPPQKYSVAFYDYDNTLLQDITYNIPVGTVVAFPTVASRDDYYLSGWTDKATNTLVTTSSFTITKDVVFIATYARKYYDVDYYYTLGGIDYYMDTVSIPGGGNAKDYAPEIPTITGYSNGHWSDETAMANIHSDNLSFYAIYTSDTVSVNFEYFINQEGQYETYSVSWPVARKTQLISAPDNVENVDDYVFCYWYVEKNGVKLKVDFPYYVVGEMTFRAYYISYDEGTEGIEYEYDPITDGYYISEYFGDDEEIVIPDTYTTELYGTKDVKGIVEGNELNGYRMAFLGSTITSFHVRSTNRYFRVKDSALYSKDLKTLYFYPMDKEYLPSDSTEFTINSQTTKIFCGAFKYSDLTSISMSDNVTTIGYGAFADCEKLTSINISNNIATIEGHMFANDINLSEITFGTNVTNIKDEALYGCSGLTKIVLPGKLELIGENVFFRCSSLRDVSISGTSSMFKIDNGVLYGKYVSTANNFYYYLYLYPAKNRFSARTEYEVNANCQVIKSGAFISAELNGIYVNSPAITLEKGSFGICGVETIRFGINTERVTISQDTFINNTDIYNTDIVDGLIATKTYTYLEDASIIFNELKDDGTVVDNISMSYISTWQNQYVFETYTIANWAPYPAFYNDYAYYTVGQTAIITGYNGNQTNLEVVEKIGNYTVVKINDYAFYNNETLRTVVIPYTIQEIGMLAFSECKNLVSFTVEDSPNTNLELDRSSKLVTIGYGAFYNDSNLSTFNYGSVILQSCGEDAFYGTNIKNYNSDGLLIIAGVITNYNMNYDEEVSSTLVIPSDITHISALAFYESPFLNIDFSNATKLLTIEDYAFYYSESLEALDFTTCPSLVYIGEYAFAGCTALNTVEYNSSTLTNLSPNAFVDTPYELGLTVVRWIVNTDGVLTAFDPDGTFNGQYLIVPNKVYNATANKYIDVKIIDEGVFSGVQSNYIYISDSVEIIRKNAFSNCIFLDKIHIGNGVTTIEKGAFKGCICLTSIYFGENVHTIAPDAFENTTWFNDYVDDFNIINDVLFKYSGKSAELHIMNGITHINEYAFYDNKYVKQVYIPESVKSIGLYAFAECTNMENIVFVSSNSSLVEIGDYAFSGCKNLQSLDLTAQTKLEIIGSHAFYEIQPYTGLSLNVYIPSSVKTLGESAFAGSGITAIRFGAASQIEEIQSNTFNTCAHLESVVFEGSSALTKIGDQAFYWCSKLVLFEAGKAVIHEISDDAFNNCYRLKTFNIDESNLRKIGIDTFYNCLFINENTDNLVYVGTVLVKCNGVFETVYIPGETTIIANAAFEGNHYVSNVVFLGDNVTTIQSKAFSGCTSLTEFYITGNITTIEEGAFSGCTRLESFEVSETNKVFLVDENGILFRYIDNGENLELAIVPAKNIVSTSTTHQFAIPESLTIGSDTLNITSLGAYAFSNFNENITSIVMPNTITNIGGYCFEKIAAEIQVSTALESIGDYAFSEYVGVSFEIPAQVTKLGKYVFSECTAEITFNASTQITELGDSAFSSYKGNTITIPENVTRIGEYCFGGCYNFVDPLIIPASVTEIGLRAFGGLECVVSFSAGSTITEFTEYLFSGYMGPTITIPDSVLYIREGAFMLSMGFIDPLIIPASVVEIGLSAFSYISCDIIFDSGSTLTEITSGIFAYFFGEHVTLPASITKIDELAFEGSGITSIDLGNIEEIGKSAFKDCYALQELIFPDTVTKISDYAFSGCSSLKRIMFTDNSQINYIGKLAFENCFAVEEMNLQYVGSTMTENMNLAYLFSETGKDVLENLDTITVYSGYIVGNALSIAQYITKIYLNDDVIVNAGGFAGLQRIEYIEMSTPSISLGVLFGASSYLVNSSFVPTSLKTVILTSGTELCQNLFYTCRNITTIEIPNTITTIGDQAFYYCDALSNIELGKNITSIGTNVFYNCVKFNEFIIDDENTHYVTDNGVLYEIDSEHYTASVVAYPIAKTDTKYNFELYVGSDKYEITKIYPYAFYYAQINTLVFDMSSSIEIGDQAFSVSSIENLVINSNEIGDRIVNSCRRISDIYILNEDIANLEDNSLGLLTSYVKNIYVLTSIVESNEFKDSYIYTNYQANGSTVKVQGLDFTLFGNTTTYKVYVTTNDPNSQFGNALVNGEYASTGNYYFIAGAEIELSVEITDPDYLFVGWYLNDGFLTLSPSFTYTIGKEDEQNIVAMFILASDALYTGDISKDPSNSDDVHYYIYYADGYGVGSADPHYYMIIAGTGAMLDNLDAIVNTDTDEYSFNDAPNYVGYMSKVVALSIVGDITNIPNYAFLGMTCLEDVFITNSVESIGNYAFAYCPKIEKIIIPENCITIGGFAFYKDIKLESIVLNEIIEHIDNDAFGYTAITEIYLPALVNIEMQTFANTYSLKEINVAKENANFASLDGVLYMYMYPGIMLYHYPAQKRGNTFAVIKKNINSKNYDILYILETTFSNNSILTNLVINDESLLNEYILDDTNIKFVNISGIEYYYYGKVLYLVDYENSTATVYKKLNMAVVPELELQITKGSTNYTISVE